MHMAPRAVAWVAWAVWTCNTYSRRFTVNKRAGFGPLFFWCALEIGRTQRAEESTCFVGSRLENQIVLAFPIGELLFDLAAHRILALIGGRYLRCSTSRKAYSKELALMTLCSTPAS